MAQLKLRRKKLSDLGLTAWGAIVFIYLFAPIAVIVVYSFNNGRVLARFSEFGFGAYVSAINNEVIVSSVITSLQAAIFSVLFANILVTIGGMSHYRTV